MGLTSFKTDQEIYNFENPFAVKEATLEHYHELLVETEFLMWMFNSAVVGAGAMIVSIVAGTAAGYALSKLRVPGATTVGRIILMSYLVPRSLLFIPLYTHLRNLGLMDSRWGLILTYSSFIAPFCTWLISGYFDTIPDEIAECALVDGASRLRALFAIDIPLVRTGMVTAVIFAFTLSWQEFIYALVFIQDSIKRTVPVGMAIFKKGDVFYWGEIMAGGLLASVPIAIFYIFIHRRMVEGMTAGAVKG
jgi:multiple sugar transport system permease protein